MIVHFIESLGGIRAVQAFRREPRNDEIFDDLNDDYRQATHASFQLLDASYWPGHPAGRQPHDRGGAALRRATA